MQTQLITIFNSLRCKVVPQKIIRDSFDLAQLAGMTHAPWPWVVFDLAKLLNLLNCHLNIRYCYNLLQF